MAKLNFQGFSPLRGQSAGRDQLPADRSYVCRILDAKIERNGYGERIEMYLEITEGEYAGFFRKDYDAQSGSGYGQKWHGIYRLNVPSEGSFYYETDLRRFNRAIGVIEESNPGFSFAATMDTDDLKGKAVGMVTRAAEFNERTYTEIGMLLTVEDARSQRFRPMQKRVSGETRSVEKPAGTAPVAAEAFTGAEEDLPF